MNTITIKNIQDAVGRLMERYHEKIWTAYLKSDKGITVSFPVKIEPDEERGGVRIEIGLRFVADRVKESLFFRTDEKQLAMFDAVDNLRPKEGDSIDSITISHGDDSVELRARGENA